MANDPPHGENATTITPDENTIHRDLLAEMADIAPNSILIHDYDGRMIYANRKTFEMHGYDKDEFMGLNLRDIDTPESVELIPLRIEQIEKQGEACFEVTHYRKDRSTFPMLVYVKKVQWAGRPALLSIGTDITERKRLETALRISERNYRTLFNAGGDGILIAELASMKFVEANPAVCKLLGYPRDELLTKSVQDIHPSESLGHVINEFVSQAEGKKLVAENIPCLTKQGTVIYTDISTVKTAFMDRDCNVGIFRDITGRRKLEEKLALAQKMEALGSLAGGIAHDFNNMLGVIAGNASYALSHLNSDEELYEVLSEIQESAKRAHNLTLQLLTFATGGEPIRKTVKLDDLVKDSVQFVARGANSTFNFDLESEVSIEADSGQFCQVICNLVINAMQAMPNGGKVQVKSQKEVLGFPNSKGINPGLYIKIEISDEGGGIPEQLLSKVFDPFFTTKPKGSGLGLATAYSIVKRHCGHLLAEPNSSGKGTTFSIYLPISEKAVGQDREEREGPKSKRRGKILIMDDQEPILKMTGRMLISMGYEPHAATDGLKAIEMYQAALQSDPFDLVICDLTVPGGMGGKETVQSLLKIDPHVKAVVSSGYSNDPVMSNYREYGFCGVISKPYTLKEMAETLNDLLA